MMSHNVYCDMVVHGPEFIKNNFLMTDNSVFKNFQRIYMTFLFYTSTPS